MTFTARASLAASGAVLLMVLAVPGGAPAARLRGVMLHPSAVGQCDFAIAVTPPSASITSGQSVRFKVGLQSLGLQGTINVGIISVSPQTMSEPSFHQPAYDIWLPMNGTSAAQITASASAQTGKTTYTVTVKGQDITGGCGHGTTHTATFTLTVT